MEKQTQPAKEIVETQFHDGSEGSRIGGDNISKYPSVGSLDENTPNESDHPYASLPARDNSIPESLPELVRRRNNRARDVATGFDVQDNEIYPRT